MLITSPVSAQMHTFLALAAVCRASCSSEHGNLIKKWNFELLENR